MKDCSQKRRLKNGRQPRYSPHPAFTMFNTGMGGMAFPGFALPPPFRSGMSQYSVECIRDDIVCPTWCLMEDEWGCKSCPCGPANGMSPARVSSGRSEHAQSSESKHDCIGTILCMLTCKDGYQLGSKQENGCQTCTCKKNNESKHAIPSQHGQGSGQDCLGPACSAKNGMRLLEQHVPPRQPKTTPKPHRCPATEICKATCRYDVQLGKPGPDGCPTCLCAMAVNNRTEAKTTTSPSQHQCNKAVACTQSCRDGYRLGPETEPDGCPVCRCIQVPTTPKPKTLLLLPVTLPPSTPPPCEEVTRCMQTCRYGYKVESQKYSTGCPQCNCIIPLSPVPPTTTEKPDFMTVLLSCPDIVHCMKTCSNGYTLKTESIQGCPVCSCNGGPTILLLCEQPLSCPQGCTVGFRCDSAGCPTCDCIKPSETKLTVEIHTAVIQSALTCQSRFTCTEKCDFGYKTSGNGCPSCQCLERIAVQIPHFSSISQPQLMTQAPPLLTITQALPQLPARQSIQLLPTKQELSQALLQPSGMGCLGPSCSAPGSKGPQEQLHVHSDKPTLESITGMCPEIGKCLRDCKNGFNIGYAKPGECPPCNCLDKSTEGGGPQPIAVQSPTNHEVHKNHASTIPARATTQSNPSVAEACPETVKCMVECNGPYNLTTNGNLCPLCSCLQKG